MTPWILLLVAGAFLQTILVPHLTLFGVHPNLVLVIVITWSLLRGARVGWLWAFVGGLLLDLLSVAPLGTFTLPLLLIALLIGLMEQTVFRLTLWIPLAITAIAAPLFHLLAFGMVLLFGWETGWARVLAQMPAFAMVNVLTMFLIFPLLRKISGAGPKVMQYK